MRFERLAVDEAAGAVLAHSVALDGGTLKKGRVLSAGDIERLTAGGIAEVMAARLEAGDLGEDAAAGLVARAIGGDGVRLADTFTGRVNLYATVDGVLALDRQRLDALNDIDEAITVATLPPYARVAAGAMVATVKIITFGVAGHIAAEAERVGRSGAPLVTVAPFVPHRAGLVVTTVPGTKASVVAKRRKAVADRLERAGSSLLRALVVGHDIDSVAAAIGDLERDGADPILVFGASAIVDRGDVVPAAVIAAGGEVTALGMPVDPGNLLMLGRIGAKRVIGVPSCASSPKENGFDWVLERCLARLPVARRDIVEMGAGGLLMEIETRPQPRGRAGDPVGVAPRIAAIVLAAGRSTRMGARNKLLEELGGKPLVRHVVEAVAASRCGPILVVTGHQAAQVAGALTGLDAVLVHNPDYAAGISTSLRCGIAAVPAAADGAMVLLGDMPGITGRDIDAIAACFNPLEGRAICVPVRGGRRGNPVLWGRSLFAAIMGVTGDTGARHLLASHDDSVVEVAVDSDAIFADVDTPDALAAMRKSAT